MAGARFCGARWIQGDGRPEWRHRAGGRAKAGCAFNCGGLDAMRRGKVWTVQGAPQAGALSRRKRFGYSGGGRLM